MVDLAPDLAIEVVDPCDRRAGGSSSTEQGRRASHIDDARHLPVAKRMLPEGHPKPVIAATIGVSPATLYVHLQRLT